MQEVPSPARGSVYARVSVMQVVLSMQEYLSCKRFYVLSREVLISLGSF